MLFFIQFQVRIDGLLYWRVIFYLFCVLGWIVYFCFFKGSLSVDARFAYSTVQLAVTVTWPSQLKRHTHLGALLNQLRFGGFAKRRLYMDFTIRSQLGSFFKCFIKLSSTIRIILRIRTLSSIKNPHCTHRGSVRHGSRKENCVSKGYDNWRRKIWRQRNLFVHKRSNACKDFLKWRKIYYLYGYSKFLGDFAGTFNFPICTLSIFEGQSVNIISLVFSPVCYRRGV